MVRTIYSPEHCLQYLEQFVAQEKFVIGLILGQTSENRDNVIHLARTPDEKSSDQDSEESFNSDLLSSDIKKISSVSEAWVADHAKHVTRMLPGGMYVQGIFITSSGDIFEDPNIFSKVKGILTQIHKLLAADKYMYGNNVSIDEKLVLHMSIDTKVLVCKSIEINSNTKNTVIKPVDWKFVAKPQMWQRLECYYEFDEVYPVIVKRGGISVKNQFQQILESVYKSIQLSVTFIDGELKDGSEQLDQLVKRKKTKSGPKSANTQAQEVPKTMHISLFVPYQNTLPDTVEYLECDGSIHFSGVVASNIFMYPKATVAEAIAAVKQDVVRSLGARFTMHCDALIDDNLLPEEKVCFNEPPRRVLVPLMGRTDAIPDCAKLYLCDYLFPGEAPAEALVSVKELLDLEITEADVICDVETPADTSEFDALDGEASCEELLASPQEASRLMYITGLAFALLVLLLSVLVHYYDALVGLLT